MAPPRQSAPFRRFRQFFYFAAGASASLGTLIAGSRVLAALNGVTGTQPLSETLPNTLINSGVVAASLGLYFWEEGRGQDTMKAMYRPPLCKTEMLFQLGLCTATVIPLESSSEGWARLYFWEESRGQDTMTAMHRPSSSSPYCSRA